jgi:hypothetical protein
LSSFPNQPQDTTKDSIVHISEKKRRGKEEKREGKRRREEEKRRKRLK